jgi:hypothetical protein
MGCGQSVDAAASLGQQQNKAIDEELKRARAEEAWVFLLFGCRISIRYASPLIRMPSFRQPNRQGFDARRRREWQVHHRQADEAHVRTLFCFIDVLVL